MLIADPCVAGAFRQQRVRRQRVGAFELAFEQQQAVREPGVLFGFGRGVLLLGVFIIGGQLASFDRDEWWQNSRLIPYGVKVADWIRVMAPKGVDLLQKDELVESAVES